MSTVTWVLESEVFPKSHQSLRDAICTAGHQVVDWSDTWWQDGIPRRVGGGPTVFHGSLANAAAINDQLSWSPGSFCDTPTFNCSNWFAPSREWLLHTDWQILAADEFVESAALVCKQLGCGDQVFVRPNSPLKPFSGRVLNVDEVSLAALDYGFYFEDDALPIVVAPVRDIGREWRFVVVRSRIIAGSAYDASTRSAISDEPASSAWKFADTVAASLPAPSDVYILDICEADGALRLLEINPFGGADLYACNAGEIVRHVSQVALKQGAS
jgi:hypothetical protein